MIGITSFGGYIPRLRIERMTIYQSMGWYMPATVMVAQGERSFCNWDEDTLTMAVAASRDCLIGVDKQAVDGLYLGSTTLPFDDRQNAGIVKNALNLRDDVVTNDFSSALKSGTSALVAALSAVGSGDRKQILVTASDKRETKAAGFYEMWFGDGAASVLVGDKDVIAEFIGSHSVSYDFVDHYRGAGKRFDYTWEERWVRDEGYSKIIPEAVTALMEKLKISMADVDKLVFPCFFKAEHRKIAKKLGAEPEQVVDNLHEVCGETGSAHPLVMLANTLQKAQPGDRILLAGFGQGCDVLYFKVTDKIKDLPKRTGIHGSLENKKLVSNYTKFLQFRNLIETETGIRAEAPTQTAMTVLWRDRKMLFGLVGGKCTKCNTPQFPKMDICVNPKCKAHHTQEDYEFADIPAAVKTFTGDYLAVSVDPPTLYGMIQFEGGGRMLADFSDCELDNVFVGQPVSLSFRKRYSDEERGFSGYFWKAVPLPGTKPQKAASGGIRLDGQVAIVTGAGGGLGRTYALELAKRGAKLVINDLGGTRDGSGDSSGPADKVVDEIKAAGGEAVASYASVATIEGGQQIIDTAIEAFGRLDILINNAGILRDKTLLKMESQDFEQVLAVHLRAGYNLTRPAFLKMKEGGNGRVIMTTSAAGLYGNFGQTNYSAAKLGLVGFMNTMKLEGQKYNIMVNTIAPIAKTRLTEELLPPDLADKLIPEAVAPLVVYLCSDSCKETGMIFNAGMGYFNRAAIVQGKGTFVGDGQVPTPEQIMQNWDAINDISGAEEFVDAMAALGPMVTGEAPETPAPQAQSGPQVKDVFAKMPEAFQADKAGGVDVVFQYSISGGTGGDWYVIIKDAACTVEAGLHEKPTTTIKMSADDFLAMIGGKLNAMQAYTTGKLKIEGDLMKSQLIEKLFKF
ncbi:MAG: SDR family NAD(P)-dependent oxidoreductase [Deltaproteobacteria bacterium]|nr:SDR family NAD(P)-dependent oxidoreductase [Deltaproteobacteria bacterium]